MNTINLILRELWQLFVDDSGFALTILSVVAFSSVLSFGFHAASEILGAVIALGCLAALVESVLRAARR